MKKMRKVGKEIMQLSNTIAIILMVPVILISLILAYLGMEFDNVFYAFAVTFLVLGIIIVWLLTVLLYGYGELIDQTMETHYAVRDMQKMLYKKLDETNKAVSSEVRILSEINDKIGSGS